MRAALALALALGLAGCASLPANPENMSPEQIREWVRDKNASILCAIVNTPYGKGFVVSVGIDKGLVLSGTVAVDDQCKVSLSNTVPVAAPK